MIKTTLLRHTFLDGTLTEQADALMKNHGKAIVHALLSDFAAVAPRSALPNLIDLLSMIVLKRTEEARVWMRDILFSVSSSVPVCYPYLLVLKIGVRITSYHVKLLPKGKKNS